MLPGMLVISFRCFLSFFRRSLSRSNFSRSRSIAPTPFFIKLNIFSIALSLMPARSRRFNRPNRKFCNGKNNNKECNQHIAHFKIKVNNTHSRYNHVSTNTCDMRIAHPCEYILSFIPLRLATMPTQSKEIVQIVHEFAHTHSTAICILWQISDEISIN